MDNNSLFRFTIDTDGCDGTNEATAQGIDFSLT